MTAVTPGREELLARAAQDFIDKVDRGEARSQRSYAAFKAALAAKPSDETRDDAAKDIMMALFVTMTGHPPIDTQLDQLNALFDEALAAYRENFSTTGEKKP